MRVAGYTVEQPYCSDGFPTRQQLDAPESHAGSVGHVTRVVASVTPASPAGTTSAPSSSIWRPGSPTTLSSTTQESALAVVSGHVDGEGVRAGPRRSLRPSPFTSLADVVYVPPGAPVSVAARADVTDQRSDRRRPRVDLTRASSTTEEMESVLRGGGPARRQVVSTLADPDPRGAADHVRRVGRTGFMDGLASPPPRRRRRLAPPRGDVLLPVRPPQRFRLPPQLRPRGRLGRDALPLRDETLVAVPRGYHLCTAGPAANMWLLNFLAGPESDRDRSPHFDPAETWITDDWEAGLADAPRRARTSPRPLNQETPL